MFYLCVIFFLAHLGFIFRKLDRQAHRLLSDLENVNHFLYGSIDAADWLKSKILQYELAGQCYLDEIKMWDQLFQLEIALRRDVAATVLAHWSHLVVIYALLDSLGSKPELGSIIVALLLYVALLALTIRMRPVDFYNEFSMQGSLKVIKLFDVEKKLSQKYRRYQNGARTLGICVEVIFLGLGINAFCSNYHGVFL